MNCMLLSNWFNLSGLDVYAWMSIYHDVWATSVAFPISPLYIKYFDCNTPYTYLRLE